MSLISQVDIAENINKYVLTNVVNNENVSGLVLKIDDINNQLFNITERMGTGDIRNKVIKLRDDLSAFRSEIYGNSPVMSRNSIYAAHSVLENGYKSEESNNNIKIVSDDLSQISQRLHSFVRLLKDSVSMVLSKNAGHEFVRTLIDQVGQLKFELDDLSDDITNLQNERITINEELSYFRTKIDSIHLSENERKETFEKNKKIIEERLSEIKGLYVIRRELRSFGENSFAFLIRRLTHDEQRIKSSENEIDKLIFSHQEEIAKLQSVMLSLSEKISDVDLEVSIKTLEEKLKISTEKLDQHYIEYELKESEIIRKLSQIDTAFLNANVADVESMTYLYNTIQDIEHYKKELDSYLAWVTNSQVSIVRTMGRDGLIKRLIRIAYLSDLDGGETSRTITESEELTNHIIKRIENSSIN
jgi:predicted  nucleic acid-binding Zn-ribbon protein